MTARRIAALLAGLWAGAILAIAALAAPDAFALLDRAQAGRFVNRLFMQEAYASLVVAGLLFAIERRRARDAAEAGRGSVLSGDLLLVLGALFCTVAGYFAVQPLMEAARAGQGPWSFGALHGASAVLFAVKGVLVLILAWRLGRPATDGAAVRPSATS